MIGQKIAKKKLANKEKKQNKIKSKIIIKKIPG